MEEIMCKDVYEDGCTNMRKIKNHIIERCEKCGDVARGEFDSYTGVLNEDPIKLTIEKWEFLAKTGLHVFQWEKFTEINKIQGYCGFVKENLSNEFSAVRCDNCKFYDKTKNIGNRCFSGLHNKWKMERDTEKRKIIADRILKIIRKVYENN